MATHVDVRPLPWLSPLAAGERKLRYTTSTAPPARLAREKRIVVRQKVRRANLALSTGPTVPVATLSSHARARRGGAGERTGRVRPSRRRRDLVRRHVGPMG